MISDVAISYDGDELERLRRLERVLVAAGLTTWSDQQSDEVGVEGFRARRVMPGADHWRAIRAAIDHSACLVYLDSAGWRASEYCQNEFEHARSQGKRIIGLSAGEPPSTGASERIDEHDDKAVVEAVREGLVPGRAHARLLVTVEAEAGDGVSDDPPSQEDLRLLARSDLGSVGLTMSDAMLAGLERTQRRHRARARRNALLAGSVLAALAALTAVALIARADAKHDQGRATAQREHVESLALATRSAEALNSLAALDLAKRAVDAEANPESVAALRQAVAQLGDGVEMTGLPISSPRVAAISDDGSLIAESDVEGGLALIQADRPGATRFVPAAEAKVGGLLAVSPDDGTVLSVDGEGGAAEVIDVATGKVRVVPGTAEIAAILYLKADRALAVSHAGGVYRFDPGAPHLAAEKLAQLNHLVRAAALAGFDAKGEPRLATLDDKAVEVTDLATPGTPWRVGLHVAQEPFRTGWETISVCGDRLDLVTTDHPPESAPWYAIPYSVTPAGKTTRTGSFNHSFGLICMPDGHALAVDPVFGQRPFPAGGPELPALLPAATGQTIYALASSDNGRWAVVGTDGFLKVVDLATYGRQYEVDQIESLAPAPSGMIGVAGSRISVVGEDGSMKQIAVGPPGTPAPRGAYLDPGLGTVVAIGTHVLVVDGDQAKARADLHAEIGEVSPGPGSSTIALYGGGQAAIVSLSDGRVRSVPLPGDLRAGGGEAIAVLQGPGEGMVLVASTNGRLDLLRLDGSEIRGANLPLGPIDLVAAPDGAVLAATGDGFLHLLDARMLTELRSRRVLPEGAGIVESDPAAKLAVVFGVAGKAALVALPRLSVLAEPPVQSGLRAAVFADHGSKLLLAADVPYIDGTHDASITDWPVCRQCLGSPGELLRETSTLAPVAAGRRATFVPTSQVKAPAAAKAAGAAEVATAAGIGPLRLGASAASLRQAGLIGPLRPGCELAPGQMTARLMPPLNGFAVFDQRSVGLSAIDVSAGAEAGGGVHIGSSVTAARAEYPTAEYDPPQPSAPIPVGLIWIGRAAHPQLSLVIDPQTHRVTEIDVPGPNFCE